MTTLLARRYDTGAPVRVSFAQGMLSAAEPIWTRDTCDDWPWIAPGLFDLQVNGYGGVWFSDETLTVENVLGILDGFRRRGVTRLLPTLITNSHEALRHGFSTLDAALRREPWAAACAPGFHLEGPFISSEDGPRGAHPANHVRPCDWSEFEALNRAGGGRIRLVTLAPEQQGAPDFIRCAAAAGITVAIGHTSASTAQIDDAIMCGARLSTHLGNGVAPVMRRHPNCLWDQLADSRLFASVIADGRHLPAAVLRAIVAVKGRERTIIVSDASGLAGCAEGFYDTAFGRYEILADGRIVVDGQGDLLAGSALTTETCVARMMASTGVSLGTACDMAGRVPASLLDEPVGQLVPGERANHIVFRWSPGDLDMAIENVFTPFGATASWPDSLPQPCVAPQQPLQSHPQQQPQHEGGPVP